jgi:hypothetical protein
MGPIRSGPSPILPVLDARDGGMSGSVRASGGTDMEAGARSVRQASDTLVRIGAHLVVHRDVLRRARLAANEQPSLDPDDAG